MIWIISALPRLLVNLSAAHSGGPEAPPGD
jgi:hypothetical protein